MQNSNLVLAEGTAIIQHLLDGYDGENHPAYLKADEKNVGGLDLSKC